MRQQLFTYESWQEERLCDALQPLKEVLPQDLVCSVLACLHDPLTRLHAQLVCKAWKTSLASSVRDVRICAGGAASLRQLEWLLGQGEESAQQLQVGYLPHI